MCIFRCLFVPPRGARGHHGDDHAAFRGTENLLKVHRVSAELEPVLRSEHPWENAMIGAYATVLKDDGLYRCWYEPYYFKADLYALYF